MDALPFVDEHRLRVSASRERTWAAATELARRLSSRPAPAAFVALWDLQPVSGFALDPQPARLVLRGRHRFSRYELAFDVLEESGEVTVRARTHAEFPGVRGRTYRALVIGSGGHGVAVRRMLERIARAAERD